MNATEYFKQLHSIVDSIKSYRGMGRKLLKIGFSKEEITQIIKSKYGKN